MIAVLGPGGVGGLVAAALSRSGEDVVVIAREATAALLAREGIRVESARLGSFTARPRAEARLEEPAEVLVIATKAPALEDAARRVGVPPALVVPLLNGVEHVAALRERFPRVAAAAIRVQSERAEPGVIRHTSAFARIDLAPEWDDAVELAGRLQRAGLDTGVSGDEATVLWSKLVRLCALALATTAYDSALGPIRDTPELNDELRACVGEAAAVAGCEGARIDARTVLSELAGLPADATSSLRRDVAAGRPDELDAIAGAVVRAGARHDLRCPAIERLAGRVRDRAGR